MPEARSTPYPETGFSHDIDMPEGWYWSGHSSGNGTLWRLVDRANPMVRMGSIQESEGWYDRSYTVRRPDHTVTWVHETRLGAAYRLVAWVRGDEMVTHHCTHCGEGRQDCREVSFHRGVRWVCTECYRNREYTECGRCARTASPVRPSQSNGSLCVRCQEFFTPCTMCSVLHNSTEEQCCEDRPRCVNCSDYERAQTDVILSGGEEAVLCSYCIRSYQECSHCEEFEYSGNMIRVAGMDGLWCIGYARHEGLRECNCGVWSDPDDEDGCCDSAGESLIKSYSFRPPIVFHGDSLTQFGLEVEIKAPRLGAMARLADRGFGDLAVLKHDGSVSGGFEIVTQPMDYGWAMGGGFPWQTFSNLADAGCYADDACGIHVHVSKAGFADPSHDHRWILFIHRNADQVQSLARRRASSWASFDRADRRMAKGIAQKKEHNHRRYVAINAQNPNTYEVRVFASSLDVVQVQAAMGLVSATVEYTRQLSARKIIRENGWAWSAFLLWLADKDEYSPLMKEIERLSLNV